MLGRPLSSNDERKPLSYHRYLVTCLDLVDFFPSPCRLSQLSAFSQGKSFNQTFHLLFLDSGQPQEANPKAPVEHSVDVKMAHQHTTTTAAEIRNDIVLQDGDVRHRQKSVGLVEISGPDGHRRTVNLEELSEADAQLASQFGYNPVFKREFGYLSTFSFAVSISGLFATIMTTFSYPLYAGGSASAVWCWLISGAGCMCIAVSALICQRLCI